MKKLVILMVGLFMALASANALAKPVDVTNESFASVPVVKRVVKPEVAPHYAGEKFSLTFVVDKNGKVREIESTDRIDPELIKVISFAVSKWEFVPAYRNGVAVSTKVVLPVIIVGS